MLSKYDPHVIQCGLDTEAVFLALCALTRENSKKTAQRYIRSIAPAKVSMNTVLASTELSTAKVTTILTSISPVLLPKRKP